MSRGSSTVDLPELASDGVVSVTDLVARGWTHRAVDHQVAIGRLVRVGRGVVRLGDHPWTWRPKLRAAVLFGGSGAVVGLRSAARLHCQYAYRSDESIEVLVRRGIDHRASLGRFVQTRHLPDDHIVVVDGFRATSVARTCFDLAGDPPPALRGPVGALVHEQKVAAIVNDALARRGLTFAAEVAVLLAHGKRGRNGTRIVRRLMKQFGPRYQPTQSDGESLFIELVAGDMWPIPEKQVPLSDTQGWIGTVDFLFVHQRVIVEVDSVWHDGPIDQERDEARDARLVAAGFVVLRVRYGSLVTAPSTFLRRLNVALNDRTGGSNPRWGVDNCPQNEKGDGPG